jgi:putative protease
MILKKPKLLSPVGSFEMLVAAIKAGADAVYLGIKGLNMRERASNFEIKELKKVVDFAHKNNVEVYLTVNTIYYDNELTKIKKIIKKAKEYKVDAIIAWDLSVIGYCKEIKMPVHLSTQASVANIDAIKQYYRLGVNRFVLARELSLDQIKNIIKESKKISKKIEIETFVHGAMCVSVSGRCFMSQFLYGDKTSANRGKCIQPCRRKYIIKDPETQKELEVHNNYILSPKDMCTIPFIDILIKSGIAVFKIEGRARSPEYVKKVTESYREAIDSYFNKKLDIKLKKKLLEKVKTVYNRGFSDGFYLGKPINEWTDSYGSKATKKKTYIGKINKLYKKINVAEIKIEANKLKVNQNILIIGPATGVIEQTVDSMQIDVGKPVTVAKKGAFVAIKIKDKKPPKISDKVYIFE